MNKLETNKDLFNCLIKEGLFMVTKCDKCGWENIIRPFLKDHFFCSKCGYEYNIDDNN